jgi:chorismate synthase
MVALVLADALLEKFGGDSLGELKRNFAGYLNQLEQRQSRIAAAAAAHREP